MSETTATFRVENLSTTDLVVAIEPWAQALTLSPEDKIEFTYPNNGKAVLDISYGNDGSITVGLMHVDITYRHGSKEVTWRWPKDSP